MNPTIFNLLLTLLFASYFTTACDDYFMIVHPKSGFALDASDDFIRLQKIIVQDTQLWKLEPTRNGQFYIVNKATKKILDTDYRWGVYNSYAIVGKRLSELTSSKGTQCNDSCQKWYIHYGGSIVNACGDTAFALDTKTVSSTNIKVETLALSYKEYQTFSLQYVNKDCHPVQFY